MNIYIYGNSGFKKEIHQTLEHANIKFKLDESSIIKDITDLEELKSAIEYNPNDIYLIDDEKIIKKSGISKKIKFLTPKDGIEEEFLLDNGIADLSIDSLKEIPKYILQKFEQEKESNNEDIQNSIIEIVDEAYNEIEEKNEKSENSLELDDELSMLLSSEIPEEDLVESSKYINDFEEIKDDEEKEFPFEKEMDFESIGEDNNNSTEALDVNLDDLDKLMDFDEEEKKELSDDELDSIINFDEDVGLNNVSFDYDDDNLIEEETNFKNSIEVSENEDIIDEMDNIDNLLDEVSIKGEEMSNEFSELDSLSEADIMSALDNLDDVKPLEVPANKAVASNSSSKEQSVELESSNVNDIAGLISKLLNNKTLEITIKIKD